MKNLFNKLLLLSASALCLFAACDDDSDGKYNPFSDDGTELINHLKNCTCEVGIDLGDGDIFWSDELITVKDFDGDCEDVRFSDLPDGWKLSEDSYVIKCHEE